MSIFRQIWQKFWRFTCIEFAPLDWQQNFELVNVVSKLYCIKLVNDRNRNFRPKPIPKPKLFRFGFGSVILTETETAFSPHFYCWQIKNSFVNSNYTSKIATNDTKTKNYVHTSYNPGARAQGGEIFYVVF